MHKYKLNFFCFSVINIVKMSEREILFLHCPTKLTLYIVAMTTLMVLGLMLGPLGVSKCLPPLNFGCCFLTIGRWNAIKKTINIPLSDIIGIIVKLLVIAAH